MMQLDFLVSAIILLGYYGNLNLIGEKKWQCPLDQKTQNPKKLI